ncbi:MAG: methyltransferase domain-containing protein [Pseudomonadota bacterium]
MTGRAPRDGAVGDAVDRETIALYDAEAARYAEQLSRPAPSDRLRAFMAALPPGARVLDLGCGPGSAAAAMQASGFSVDALDASAGMVRVAKERFGVSVRHATFADVDTGAGYAGIWANFSLLHAPRADMPEHLARLYCALAPGGRLHIGLKTGAGEARDSLGRLYTFYAPGEIEGLIRAAGFEILSRDEGEGRGFDGTLSPWIVLAAHRPAAAR